MCNDTLDVDAAVMSGMHLLPIYYTTTVHSRKRKKSRKISKSMQEAQRKHDKFLKSMGIGTEKKRSVAQSVSVASLLSDCHRFISDRSDQPFS